MMVSVVQWTMINQLRTYAIVGSVSSIDGKCNDFSKSKMPALRCVCSLNYLIEWLTTTHNHREKKSGCCWSVDGNHQTSYRKQNQKNQATRSPLNCPINIIILFEICFWNFIGWKSGRASSSSTLCMRIKFSINSIDNREIEEYKR